jgi:hypothetical protein
MRKTTITTIKALLAAAILLTCNAALAVETTPLAIRHGLTSSEYQSAFNNYTFRGYRLRRISGYEVNNSARFAAVWEKAGGASWRAYHKQTAAQFKASFDANVAAGYRMTFVDSYEVGGKIWYAAIWSKESGPRWYAYRDMSPSEYQTRFERMSARGYRVTCVSGCRVGWFDYYTSIWERKSGPAVRAHHGQSTSDYAKARDKNFRDGYRPVHVSVWAAGTSSRIASIWEKVYGGPISIRVVMTNDEYKSELDNRFHTGYRLQGVSGYTINGAPRFAAIWENGHLLNPDLHEVD